MKTVTGTMMKGTINDIRVNLDDRLDSMWTWSERQQNKQLIRQIAAEVAKHAEYSFHAENLRVGLNLAKVGKGRGKKQIIFFHIEWAASGGNTKRSNRFAHVLRAETPKRDKTYNYHSYHGWKEMVRRFNDKSLNQIVRKRPSKKEYQ